MPKPRGSDDKRVDGVYQDYIVVKFLLAKR